MRALHRRLIAATIAVVAISVYVVTWYAGNWFGAAWPLLDLWPLLCHGVIPIVMAVVYFGASIRFGPSVLVFFAVLVVREITQWGICALEGGRYWGPTSGSMGDVESHIWASVTIAGIEMLVFLITNAVCYGIRPCRPRYAQGYCQSCGYDARGNAGVICPECGHCAKTRAGIQG